MVNYALLSYNLIHLCELHCSVKDTFAEVSTKSKTKALTGRISMTSIAHHRFLFLLVSNTNICAQHNGSRFSQCVFDGIPSLGQTKAI